MNNLAIKLKEEVLLLGQKIRCIEIETWKNYKLKEQEYSESMYLKIGYSPDELEKFIDMALSLGDTPADELPGINGITDMTIWLYGNSFDSCSTNGWCKLSYDSNSPNRSLLSHHVLPYIPNGCIPDNGYAGMCHSCGH